MAKRYIVLFGGQGSRSIFSANVSATAAKDSASTTIGSILLSMCHAAFLQEIASLDATLREKLALNPLQFSTPHDLLRPPEEYHTHAVLQATSIYLCQLLHFLHHALDENESLEQFFDQIQETAGFSSGLLGAIVVARSRSSEEFLKSTLEGFRVAFWIAFRSHLCARDAEEIQVGNNDNKNLDVAWSLMTRGLTQAEVEERLSQYVVAQGKKAQHIQISAICTSTIVSLSGPPDDLKSFREQIIPDVPTAFTHIHGWYHGGTQLEAVARQVLADLHRRDICFPPCPSRAKPIRSTLNGSLFNTSDVESSELLEWLVWHLLVHRVNWRDTVVEITASIKEAVNQGLREAIKILSFGPGSSTLLSDLQFSDPRVELLDLSLFRAQRSTELPDDYKDNIAIVGMSVNLPKGGNTDQLWESLSQGLEAVQEIPQSRFKVSDYYSKDSKPHSMPVKHGAFLDDPFSFDNGFFKISPREARSMDPQQRVLLHSAQEALEDAGYVEDSSPSFQRASFGCYVGIATGDYTDNLRDDIDVFYSPGTLRAFHSGRISYFYKLSGPSIVTDTACSSSLVSIYQACRALQRGDCTAAIAGGVNVISSPDMYLGLARGHFLSQSGGCKPFDTAADGYCRAEGCVLFVLKRLSDAVAENDRIHGVIRDVMVNQSGNSHSITHPHSETQVNLFQRLLRQTKIHPESISVVEAHGTGTQAGDVREIESLKEVFAGNRSVGNPLFISSIKGNIGHCEAASGAAGLAKLLLMLQKKQIPAQAGYKIPNPGLGDLESCGFVIPRQVIPWQQEQRTPRRALLNNFGAAGSNASLLLEEWADRGNVQSGPHERSSYVFCLSAKSEKALQESLRQHIEFLERVENESDIHLRDICYTATARRQMYHHRISATSRSVKELRTKLEQLKEVKSIPPQSVSVIVFIFSGQGALYDGMSAELMNTLPLFKNTIDECDAILQDLGFPSIQSRFCKPREEIQFKEESDGIVMSQCACVALEYALAKVFISWGLAPQYIIGHSLGEYVALCISGALTLRDTLFVVASRAKLMIAHCLSNSTGMLACNLSCEQAGVLILQAERLSELTVTCFNGIGDCVVGGPFSQLDEFQRICNTQKVRTKLLQVPYAFHSSAMDPILEHLKVLGGSIDFAQPTIPIISTVFGRLLSAHDLTHDYFATHTRDPVRFTEAVGNLKFIKPLYDGAFIEIGPHPILLPVLPGLVASDGCTYLPTLRKGQDDWVSISSTLSELSLRNESIAWRQVFAESSARVISLPGHPLEGITYFTPYNEGRQLRNFENLDSTAILQKTGFNLLPWMKDPPQTKDDRQFALETTLKNLGPLISGHDVGGNPICPASVFHELALEAVAVIIKPQDGLKVVVTDLSFATPLLYAASEDADTVTIYVTKTDKPSEVQFKIASTSSKSSVQTIHSTGNVSLKTPKDISSSWMKDAAIVSRQRRYLCGAGRDNTSIFRTKVLYEAVFARVVKYSFQYQTLQHLNVADGNLEGIGLFKLPDDFQASGYVVPPVFTDTLLHAAGFIANLAVKSDEAGICARIEYLEIFHGNIDYTDSFTIYCSLLEVKGAILADSIALNGSGEVVAVIRGMEFKRLRLATFQQALSRRIETSSDPHDIPESDTTSEPVDTPIKSSLNSPIHDIRKTLNAVIVEICGFSEQSVDYTKTLEELGIDSLMQIEIVSRLAREFPEITSLSQLDLSECETLSSLEHNLVSIMQSSKRIYFPMENPESTSYQVPCQQRNSPISEYALADKAQCENPVALHSSPKTSGIPLFLFHDGSGQVSAYARMRNHDRDTYAFFDPYFGNEHRPFSSISQIAKNYISRLRLSKSSSLIVGGWSFGGVVAYEAARQLMATGFNVKGLVLIDSPSPIEHQPLPESIISHIIKSNTQTSQRTKGSKALSKEFQFCASLLGSYNPRPSSADTSVARLCTVLLKSEDTIDTEALYGVGYEWLSSKKARDAEVIDWEELVGGPVKVLPIPGNHFEPFCQQNIQRTEAQLWKACQFISETSYSNIE